MLVHTEDQGNCKSNSQFCLKQYSATVCRPDTSVRLGYILKKVLISVVLICPYTNLKVMFLKEYFESVSRTGPVCIWLQSAKLGD